MILGNDMFDDVKLSQNSIDSLVEAFIIDEFNHNMTDEEKEEFVNSSECKEMIEAGILSEASVVYLDRGGDLNRRITLAALQLAKDKGDPLYKKLVFVAQKRKGILAQLRQKYNVNAKRSAKVAQKELIKKVPTRFKKKIVIR